MRPRSARKPFGVKIALIGIFAALAFGVNAPFLAIPNVEIFSLALFLSGLYLGTVNGMAAAAVAGIIFVFFNPNGIQPVLLVGMAQLVGFILFALVGGLLRPTILKDRGHARTALILIVTGLLLTFWYDLSTNLAFAALFGPFWPVLVAGLGFSLVHIAGNGVIFGLAATVVSKIWKRIEYIMPPLAG
jgi:hypothetical protein